MATTYSYLFALRHPRSPWRVPIWIGTQGIAAATAVLRVQAGKHFWSDVLTGAVVGSAIGWLVPYLHRVDLAGKIFGERRLLSELRVTPAVFSGGWGVNAMAFW
jgi:membrane-associated phospholipid phosphatase